MRLHVVLEPFVVINTGADDDSGDDDDLGGTIAWW